jgi:hypothetical protein
MSGQAPAFYFALHADEFVLAELGRAVVPRADGKKCATWKLRKCAGINPYH